MNTKKSISQCLGVTALALLATFRLADAGSFDQMIKSYHAMTDAERLKNGKYPSGKPRTGELIKLIDTSVGGISAGTAIDRLGG